MGPTDVWFPPKWWQDALAPNTDAVESPKMPRRSSQIAPHAESAAPPATTKAFCNRCGGQTNHEIMRSHQARILREDTPIRYIKDDFFKTFRGEFDDVIERNTFTVEFEILECRGCNSVIARRKEYLSVFGETEWKDILSEQLGCEGFQSLFEVTQYPPAMARRAPLWMIPLSHSRRRIATNVAETMEEIYKALQNGSPRLVAMGIRAALEQIMVSKTGDHGSFLRNLDAFQAANYLSVRQRNTVEAILDAGHATIHRGWRPKDADISTLLDITESVIETTYLHERRAKDLERKIPRRRPRRSTPAI